MNSLYNVFNQLLYCTPWNCYYSNQSWILKWKRYHRVSFWTWVYWITFYTEILLYLGQTFQTHRTTHIGVSSIFVSNNLHGFSKPPVSKIWILLKFGPMILSIQYIIALQNEHLILWVNSSPKSMKMGIFNKYWWKTVNKTSTLGSLWIGMYCFTLYGHILTQWRSVILTPTSFMNYLG